MVVGSRKVFEMLGGNPKSESDSGEEEIHGALVLQALTWRRSNEGAQRLLNSRFWRLRTQSVRIKKETPCLRLVPLPQQ